MKISRRSPHFNLSKIRKSIFSEVLMKIFAIGVKRRTLKVECCSSNGVNDMRILRLVLIITSFLYKRLLEVFVFIPRREILYIYKKYVI